MTPQPRGGWGGHLSIRSARPLCAELYKILVESPKTSRVPPLQDEVGVRGKGEKANREGTERRHTAAIRGGGGGRSRHDIL